MFPDDPKPALPRGGSGVTTTTGKLPSADRNGLPVVAVVPAAVGGGQRSTLYDSFELNAMVVRLNRLLNGDGGRRPPRRTGSSWLAVPKVLFRKIKCALLGGRQGDS